MCSERHYILLRHNDRGEIEEHPERNGEGECRECSLVDSQAKECDAESCDDPDEGRKDLSGGGG